MKRATETQQLAELVGVDLDQRRVPYDTFVAVPIVLLLRAAEKIKELQACAKSPETSGRIPLTYE